MADIKEKLLQILLAIFIVVMAGAVGYYLIFSGEVPFLDCLYMTVISLTSVGYGEVIPITGNTTAQIFTMILIIFGMGVILYGISTLTALMIEGDVYRILRTKKMKRQIARLTGHYIVCGGGETGRPLVAELLKNKEDVVLIEKEQFQLDKCRDMTQLLYIHGDATDDDNLIQAGILNAKGIITCLPSDKDNIYVTMTARMLRNDIRIISRMTDPHMEPKLIRAGANRVVSPNFIGALRMASEMIRPTVVDFLDRMLRTRQGTLRIHQISISDHSDVIGLKIKESRIRDRFDLLILGLKRPDSDIDFNPSPDYVLKKGTSLIVMGEMDNIERARREL